MGARRVADVIGHLDVDDVLVVGQRRCLLGATRLRLDDLGVGERLVPQDLLGLGQRLDVIGADLVDGDLAVVVVVMTLVVVIVTFVIVTLVVMIVLGAGDLGLAGPSQLTTTPLGLLL